MSTTDSTMQWLRSFPDGEVPSDRPTELLDVRSMGPPHPLTTTLETLLDLDPAVVLVQLNDRAPQHLYPKLRDRAYEYATIETEDGTVTAIWRPDRS